MEEVHYRGDGPYWAIEPMKKNKIKQYDRKPQIYFEILFVLKRLFIGFWNM